jgi:hypothetical protein
MLCSGWFRNSSRAAMVQLEANLDCLQEVPPNASPAFGFGDIMLDTTAGTATVATGSYQDLLGNSSTVRISDAAVGANGPTIFLFTLDAPGTFSGNGPLTPAQVNYMLLGNTYINITSNVFPSGEIRGQLLQVPEPATLGILGIGSIALLKRRARTN